MTTSAAFTFHLMTYVLHMLVQSRLKDNYIVHSTAKLLHSNIELELRKILITTIHQKWKNVVVLCKTHFISTFIHVLCNKLTNTTEEFGSHFQPDFLSKTREGTKIQYKIRVTNTGPISVKVVPWNKQIEDLQVDQWVISSRRPQTSIEINGNLHFSQIWDSETSLNFTNCFQM